MKKFFNYLKHNTHFFLLLYALIYIPWFTYLEKKVNINSNFHVIHVALDDYIPFCEFFVIPYYLWFVYMNAWKQIRRCIRRIQFLHNVYKNIIPCKAFRPE